MKDGGTALRSSNGSGAIGLRRRVHHVDIASAGGFNRAEMSFLVPDEVRTLLASGGADRNGAWAEFLARHSDLIMAVAHRLGGGRDRAMDRYTFVVEALCADDCHRLRGYVADGRGLFTTWLAIVVRRLCFDHHRHRYGRLQGDTPTAADRHIERRNLVDLIGDELALDELPDGRDADLALRRTDLHRALAEALNHLDPSDRLILRFRFEEGLSVPEIARATAAESPFRVYRRLDAVLAGVRTALERAGIEGPNP